MSGELKLALNAICIDLLTNKPVDTKKEPQMTRSQEAVFWMLGIRAEDGAQALNARRLGRLGLMQADDEEPSGITAQVTGVLNELQMWLSQGVTDDRGTLGEIAKKLAALAK